MSWQNVIDRNKKGVSQNSQTPSIIGICSYCVLDRPVFERCQTLLHPELIPWWSFLLADGAPPPPPPPPPPELGSNKGNKHQNNTWVSAETVRRESTYIILFLTRHNKSINDNKNDNLYTSPPCLSLGFCSADDITIDCWWHHNDQTIVTRSGE